MKLKTTLNGQTFAFRDIRDVLAKANEPKAADRLADHLADLDKVALLHTGLGRSAQMHAHGNANRIGHEVSNGDVSGGHLPLMLTMHGVYAALERILRQIKHQPFGVE